MVFFCFHEWLTHTTEFSFSIQLRKTIDYKWNKERLRMTHLKDLCSSLIDEIKFYPSPKKEKKILAENNISFVTYHQNYQINSSPKKGGWFCR